MKQETKPIQIDSKLHADLKQYCNERGLKLQKIVEMLIKEKLKVDGSSISTS
jgi:hypothetical protein